MTINQTFGTPVLRFFFGLVVLIGVIGFKPDALGQG